MDEPILNTLQVIGWAGSIPFSIFLLGKYGVFKLFSKGRVEEEVDPDGNPITLASLHETVSRLGTNHLHILPEMKNTLERIDRTMGANALENNRLLNEINKSLEYIKARINGR